MSYTLHGPRHRDPKLLDIAGMILAGLALLALAFLALSVLGAPAHAAPPCQNGRCAPVVAQQIVGLNPYIYAVTPQYAAPNVAAADVDGILSAARQVERLRAGLGDIQAQGLQQTQAHQQRMQQALTAPPLPEAQPVKATHCPCPDRPIAPPVEPAAPAASDIDAKVLAIFAAKCAKCHGANGKGGLSLVTGATLVEISPDKRWKVWGMAHGGDMPPAPAPALSDDEVETLRQWARQK